MVCISQITIMVVYSVHISNHHHHCLECMFVITIMTVHLCIFGPHNGCPQCMCLDTITVVHKCIPLIAIISKFVSRDSASKLWEDGTGHLQRWGAFNMDCNCKRKQERHNPTCRFPWDGWWKCHVSQQCWWLSRKGIMKLFLQWYRINFFFMYYLLCVYNIW